jgi:signal transduction histidine kinase
MQEPRRDIASSSDRAAGVALEGLLRIAFQRMRATLQSQWQNLSLSKQFVSAAIAVLMPGMALTGWWISSQVNVAVVRNTAAATVISMDGLLAPLVDEIKQHGDLSVSSRDKLDGLLAQVRADKRIVSMKIWRPDGTVIYSSFRDVIGKKFDLSDNFAVALAGGIGADFDDEPHKEDLIERQTGIKLLEVYAPVRDPLTRNIIAVSEFYANGDQLVRDVSKATIESWLFVCAIAAVMLGLLSLIAAKGGRTIALQQKQLQTQVSELQNLLAQNETLRDRLRQANEDVSSINETVLRHVGADLHDGPAQKLSYAVMRLSSLKRLMPKGRAAARSVNNMGRILVDTLADVRRMSGGLVLPELKEMDLLQSIEHAIKSHENYSGSKVKRQLGAKGLNTSLALRTCIYRLVQESLNNSFKHAGGKGQTVILTATPEIALEVRDAGPGISQSVTNHVSGFGLRGMQARVEALGGVLTVGNKSEGGTVVRAVFPAT